MNDAQREKRIELAREYLNEALDQSAVLAACSGFFAVFTILIFIFLFSVAGVDPFSKALVWLVLLFLVLIFSITMAWYSADEIRKYKIMLQDVDGNLEEIESLKSAARKRIQKQIQKQNTTPSSGTAYVGHRSLADMVYGEHGWRKTIPHSEYTKYHIKLEDYETEYEYEDALRRAKSHYDHLHDDD